MTDAVTETALADSDSEWARGLPDTYEEWTEYHRCVRCLKVKALRRCAGMVVSTGCACGGPMQRDWLEGSTNLKRSMRRLP